VKQRGFGYIEIVIVLAVVAVAGYLLMQYFTSTAKTVEKMQQDRPLARTKLAADQATLTSVQGLVRNYQAEKGQFPPDKATVVGLLASPPGSSARATISNTTRHGRTRPHHQRRLALLTTREFPRRGLTHLVTSGIAALHALHSSG